MSKDSAHRRKFELITYLCNQVMRGMSLSEAVRTARANGYTEPHPRDDLSGLDVARKALILAREMEIPLSIEDVVVEPFVPAHLLAHTDLEAFFQALRGHDDAFASQVQEMKSRGCVLRYLARVDPNAPAGTPVIRVAPIAIENDHPAARLRGSEAFVAFTTERYKEYPLIVQGAGAGGAVTAAGVLTDVLKIAQTLRGR